MKTTPMRTNESAAGSTRLLHRLTAALLALVLAASAALPVFAADTAPTDTIYINSVSDLLAFADKCGFDQWSKGKTVILQEDLSLEDTEWAPVASFSGAFKGNGHTISDVSLVGADSPAGFFGILEEGGSIQDLTIKGVVNPAGTQKTAGGLVGTNYGTIINCTFSGAVHGEEEAGGLVGRNETSGTIDHSTSRAMVSGAYATGGIVGYNLGVITGCTNVGAVNSEYQESALDMEGLPATLLELVKKDMGDDLSNNISNVSSDTGGIAGRSSGLILSSANAGDVGYAHVGYNVGGIVGRTDGLISGCVNQGLVQGRQFILGVGDEIVQARVVEHALRGVAAGLGAVRLDLCVPRLARHRRPVDEQLERRWRRPRGGRRLRVRARQGDEDPHQGDEDGGNARDGRDPARPQPVRGLPGSRCGPLLRVAVLVVVRHAHPSVPPCGLRPWAPIMQRPAGRLKWSQCRSG